MLGVEPVLLAIITSSKVHRRHTDVNFSFALLKDRVPLLNAYHIRNGLSLGCV